MHKTFRLTLLPALLLLLAACSTPPEPTGPRGLRAVAGPDYAQLYWDAPAAPAEYRVQHRRLDTDAGWTAAADAIIDAVVGSALIPLAAEGDYEYRVGVWHDELLLWSTAPEVLTRHDGLKMQVGTFNRGSHDPAAGTVILVWLDLPEGVSLAGPMQLAGPAGWAAGEHPVHVDTWDETAGYLIEYLYGLDVVPGTYTLTATGSDGREWRSTTDFTDSDFRLAPPTDLTVTSSDPVAGTLNAAWTPPVAGAATQVSLLQADAEPVYESTFGSDHAFTGLAGFTEAGSVLEVVTSNALLQEAPRVMPVPFGIANARLELDPAD